MQNVCLNLKLLKQWFLAHKRALPWREDITPYRVWISEVMLQQTQADVVIPYFLRWMERFPTVESLANASLEEVIKMWEGLGYYSRARNLYAGAKQIIGEFGGKIPNTSSELFKIKGLGPYTVGAILNFAFHQKMAALDGNAIRVLARLLNFQNDLSKPASLKLLTQLAENILPDEEPWIISEALIELGARICKKKPNCQLCPLKAHCISFREGNSLSLPFKSNKTIITPIFRSVAILFSQGKILIKKESGKKIMADLCEFPYLEGKEKNLSKWVEDELSLKICSEIPLSKEKQAFTRYRVELTPILFNIKEPLPVESYHWKTVDELKKLAFSSGHKRILGKLSFLS